MLVDYYRDDFQPCCVCVTMDVRRVKGEERFVVGGLVMQS
jgi:hypothetical protein